MEIIRGTNLIGNDPETHAYIQNLSPFEKAEFFLKFKNDKEIKGSGYALYQEQVRIGRQLGLLTYEDDFFSSRLPSDQPNKVIFETVTRNNKQGLPVYDPENSTQIDADLPAPTLPARVSKFMSNAYGKAPEVLIADLENNISGIDISDVEDVAIEAYKMVAPAFKNLEGFNSGEKNTKMTLQVAHQNFVRKYALSKAQLTNSVPDPDEIIEELYLSTNWMIQLPGMPGVKRLIPKNIPFEFQTNFTSSDIELFMQLWQDHAPKFNNYLKQKIREDDGSSVAYVDVSQNGGGLSFYFAEKGTLVGEEDPSTLITWTEFGDWMKRKYKFAMLSEVENWFRKKDPSDPRSVLPIYNKSRYDKLIEIIRDFEDDLKNNPDQIAMNRSWVSNMFYDDADGFMYLNQNPVNVSDMRRFDLTNNPRLDFSGEWNWFLSAIDKQNEIGAIEYEVLKDLLTKVSSKTTPKEFDAILEAEMRKYFLQEKDWWDGLSNNASLFGQYATSVGKTLAKKVGDAGKLGIGLSPNRVKE